MAYDMHRPDIILPIHNIATSTSEGVGKIYEVRSLKRSQYRLGEKRFNVMPHETRRSEERDIRKYDDKQDETNHTITVRHASTHTSKHTQTNDEAHHIQKPAANTESL